MFRFLDAYSGYSTPPQNLACQEQSLRSLRSSWGWAFWRNPDFEFAQCSFVDYLMIRKIPFPVALVERFRNEKWFVEKTGLCSIEYAASAADITIQDLNQLLQHGMLRPCTWEYARRNIPILETKKLLKLKQKWKAGWSVEEASSWLGISKQNVIQLIRLGLLVIAQKTKSGKSKRLLSCQSVKEFFEKVTTQLKLFGDDPCEIISLRNADGYFNYLGVDGSVLLQFVVNGVLPAFQWRDEIQRLNQICFSLVSIHEIPDLVLGKRGCITADTFALETGIPKSLVRKWVKSGLIRAEMKIGLYDYFKRPDLEKLAGEYFSD